MSNTYNGFEQFWRDRRETKKRYVADDEEEKVRADRRRTTERDDERGRLPEGVCEWQMTGDSLNRRSSLGRRLYKERNEKKSVCGVCISQLVAPGQLESRCHLSVIAQDYLRPQQRECT